MKHDTDFQHALGRFQEDIAEGRFGREWLRQATKAFEKRSRGDFDAFKDGEFEEYWGQKQNLPIDTVTGFNKGKQFTALPRINGLQKGDIQEDNSETADKIETGMPLQEDSNVCSNILRKLSANNFKMVEATVTRNPKET